MFVYNIYLAKKYIGDVPFPHNIICGFNQMQVWNMLLVPVIPFLPREGGDNPKASWTRPTYDLLSNRLTTQYIYPIYKNNTETETERYYGSVLIDVGINDIFGDIINDKPTDNGYYFLMSLINSAVVAATNETMDILFGKGHSGVIEEYNQVHNLSNSNVTAWNGLYKNIKGDETSVEIKVNEITYYVTWAKAEKYNYALIAAIDIRELDGASWNVSAEILTFYYTEIDPEITQTIIVKNTGMYDISFRIDTTDDVKILDQQDLYHLIKGKEKPITFKYIFDNINVETTPSVIFNPSGTNYECIDAILTPVRLQKVDCVPSDYSYEIDDKAGFYNKIKYYKKGSSICRNGKSLPSTKSIPKRII